MAVSLGPFMTCFFAVLFLTVYIYIMIYVKKDILYSGMKLVFAGIALILIRMLVPFNFPFTQTIISYRILPPINKVLFNYIGNTRIDLATILFVIWVAVMLIKIMQLIWGQRQYRSCLLPFAIKDWSKYPQLKHVLSKCNASFWMVCIVPTRVSPAVVGIWKPILVLPDYRFSESELYFICLHETEHCRNYDLWLKLFLDLVICTQWFNPLVYFMRNELTLAFELSNDRVVLNTMNEKQKTEYAECVIKMVRYQDSKMSASGATLAFAHRNHSSVKTRVHYILSREKKGKVPRKLSAVLNCVIVSMVLLFSFVYVPEAYCPDTLMSENYDFLEVQNSYFIKSDGSYKLYVNNQFLFTLDTVPDDLNNVPIFEKENCIDEEEN